MSDDLTFLSCSFEKCRSGMTFIVISNYLMFCLGTCTLLDACKALGVKRFIYCSSMSVVLGLFNIIDGTESSTQYAKVPSPYHYASSKQKAETMVKETNSKFFLQCFISDFPST